MNKPPKPKQTIHWQNESYFVMSETEDYLLISRNGVDKIFSIRRSEYEGQQEQK